MVTKVIRKLPRPQICLWLMLWHPVPMFWIKWLCSSIPVVDHSSPFRHQFHITLGLVHVENKTPSFFRTMSTVGWIPCLFVNDM